MFWQKCGKLILIDCDTCPCPYWAVFLFLRRPYNQSNEEIDYCNVYADIQVKNVFNNCLTYNWGQGDVPIRITLNGNDVVGRYHDCINNVCMDVRVYKLSDCFETQAQAQAFYNSMGSAYWQSMRSKFTAGVEITFNQYRYSDSFRGPMVTEQIITWECYDMDTGQLVYSGNTQPEIPPGEEWDCYQYYDEGPTYCITTGSGRKLVELVYQLYPDVSVAMEEAIEELNGIVQSDLQNTGDWPLYSPITYYDRCFFVTYSSHYTYLGQDPACSAERYMMATRGQLVLQAYNANKHPTGATGVRLKLNYIIGTYDQNCTLTVTRKDEEITLQFGQSYNLTEIANNLAPFWQDWCNGEFIGFTSEECKRQDIEVQVRFMEYVF